MPWHPRRINPDISEELVDVIADMMEKDAECRIRTAAEVARRLEPWAADSYDPPLQGLGRGPWQAAPPPSGIHDTADELELLERLSDSRNDSPSQLSEGTHPAGVSSRGDASHAAPCGQAGFHHRSATVVRLKKKPGAAAGHRHSSFGHPRRARDCPGRHVLAVVERHHRPAWDDGQRGIALDCWSQAGSLLGCVPIAPRVPIAPIARCGLYPHRITDTAGIRRAEISSDLSGRRRATSDGLSWDFGERRRRFS